MFPSIRAAAAAFRSGKSSPVDWVDHCLDRIQRDDATLRAWVLVDAQTARATAQQLADELAAGHDRGPLHGVPVGVKDIVDVKGWPTQAGSPLRRNHVAPCDAAVVELLRSAGAVILGKTVTTEFACFDPAETRNPWDLRRTPGGSSSGSAAAVAAGMVPWAIGSQTGGSITRPASYCGVCGLKPTYGGVSLRGVVPVSFHLDHLGPIAACVSDLALAWQAMCGPNASDTVCCLPPPVDSAAPDRLSTSDRCPTPEKSVPASRPRLALLADWLDEAHPSVAQPVNRALSLLQSRGAQIVNVGLPADFDWNLVRTRHRRIMATEAAEYHRRDFAAHRRQYGPNIASLLDEGSAVSAPDYAEALRLRPQYRQQLLASALTEADALIAPATPTIAPADRSTTGDPRFNSPFSYLGLPVVSLPCGLSPENMPVAIQLIGRPWSESDLLRLSQWCESQLGFNHLPPDIEAA